MKYLLTLLLVLIYSTILQPVEGQDIEGAKQHLQQALELLESEASVTGLSADFEGEDIRLSWDAFSTTDSVDITFCKETDCFSVNRLMNEGYHNLPVDPATGYYILGEAVDARQHNWSFQFHRAEWSSKTIQLQHQAAVEPVDPPARSEMLEVISNENPDGSFSGWYSGVNGVLKIEDRWRIYFQDRTDSENWQVMYTESSNLQDWTDPKPVGTTKLIYFVQHKGQIYAYAEDEGAMHLWRSNDGINHFEHIKKAFEWKLDTMFTLYFHEENNQPRMFGRVRGTSDRGGWPDHKNIDRRGISYHKTDSDLDGNWQSRNLADPLDYFDYSKDLRPDFYQPSFRSDGTGEIVMYFRDKDNVFCYSSNDCRWTGPIYPVPARYEGGKITIESLEPAVDISAFVTDTVHYGDVTVYHPGQVYIHPVKIEHEGDTWRVISHRADEHYRPRSDRQELSGIYLVKESGL